MPDRVANGHEVSDVGQLQHSIEHGARTLAAADKRIGRGPAQSSTHFSDELAGVRADDLTIAGRAAISGAVDGNAEVMLLTLTTPRRGNLLHEPVPLQGGVGGA